MTVPALCVDISAGQVQDEVCNIDSVGQSVSELVKVLVCKFASSIVEGMPLNNITPPTLCCMLWYTSLVHVIGTCHWYRS